MTRLAFYARVSGVQDRLKTCERDISVYLFRSRAGQKLDHEYNVGEYNIYNLPDLSEFDGIILDLYNVYQKENYWYGAEASRQLIERAKASGKPVISIGNALEGFYHVGIDNYSAMQKLIRHLYEHHHYRKFWFFMGPKDYPENRQRVLALQDYLMEQEGHNYQDYFYYENFEAETGQHAMKLFLERFQELPDVIICANDRIAIGAMEEAKKRGYRIPEDFSITGFDNLDVSLYFTPGLTTVDQNWIEPGRVCIDLFCDIWDGKEVPKVTYIRTDQIYRESCGCRKKDLADITDLLNNKVFTEMNLEIFDARLDELEYGLLSCENLHQVGEVFVKSFSLLKCKALYLVLSKNYEHYDMEELYHNSGHIPDPAFDREYNFQVSGYPADMQIAFACKNGEIIMEKKPIQGLFPAFESDEPDDFLFMPIHFRKYTVGYLVIRDCAYILKNSLIMRAINALTIAVENLYTKAKLRRFNQELTQFSLVDSMTGFYNRLGFQQIAVRKFESCKEEQKDLTILFVDMDRLKYMNDHYGHECGDLALLAITGAIRSACQMEHTVAVRMGGDEFLLMLEETKEDKIQGILDEIQEDIPRMEEVSGLPYSPTVSIGYVVTNMTLDQNLDDYIRKADEIMYEIKRKKKASKMLLAE